MNAPEWVRWLAATAPLLVLLGLVLSGRVRLVPAAVGIAVATAGAAWWIFGAGPDVLGPAIGKGVWLGAWISAVVAPALLLYRLAAAAGIERLRDVVSSFVPTRLEGLLVVAWLLPSLIQGVAGFGAPIALTAPVLMAMGYGPVAAVAYPLVGYCWSVTFGSMASSFYMASGTARLDAQQSANLAWEASIMLGLLAIACAACLCVLEAGWRGLVRCLPFLLTVGVPVAGVLVAIASVVPAMATVVAAGTGFVVVALLRIIRRGRGAETPKTVPDGETRPPVRLGRSIGVIAPYLALLGVALPLFLVPASREWVTGNFVLAFDFPATRTSTGWVNEARDDYTPFPIFGHPGTFILFACAVGYIVYRCTGMWSGVSTSRVLREWAGSLPKALAPIVALTVLASVLSDAGMTAIMADGLLAVVGSAYPALAAGLGAIGSFVTGSTTSSNALLSGLQAEAARLLGHPPETFLAAQTVGGNVGNAIAPVVIATGAATVGAIDRAHDIMRIALPAAACLLVLATTLTLAATVI